MYADVWRHWRGKVGYLRTMHWVVGHKQVNANPSTELAERFKEERAERTAWLSTQGRFEVRGDRGSLGLLWRTFWKTPGCLQRRSRSPRCTIPRCSSVETRFSPSRAPLVHDVSGEGASR